MPIPSLLDTLYEEGLEKGLEQGLERGLEQGLEQAVTSLLDVRFGPDDRIPRLAGRLVGLGAERCMALIEAAAGLDDLTDATG